MTALFSAANSGIPIILIQTSSYAAWLEQQDSRAQTWLKANQYQGKGYCLIPNQEGTIARVVYALPIDEAFFIAGDLPLQLPCDQYVIELASVDLQKDVGEQETASDSSSELQLRFAVSWGLACYRYEAYKSFDKKLPVLALRSATLVNEVESYVQAITLVRDLINHPASDLMPDQLSTEVDKLAREFKAKTKHLVGDELLQHNYPTIHAVGRASIHPPRLIELNWGNKKAPKVTLVGKGVCFDSGGLDLKPSSAMRLMKKDMGGAAHALGLARLIMAQQLPIRLRVLIPAVENAVSSNALRPGDVVKTRHGLTVEIDNTDAEGRLVLCDALAEADREAPELLIDFATLTGACRVALGTELPGLFCNSQELANGIIGSGLKVNDPVWQLPLHKPYQELLKSDVADTLNSSPNAFGGAITAALYLQLFVSPTTPWVHFDLMAWNNRKLPGRPVGGEAFAIRAVFEYLKGRYLG